MLVADYLSDHKSTLSKKQIPFSSEGFETHLQPGHRGHQGNLESFKDLWCSGSKGFTALLGLAGGLYLFVGRKVGLWN